MVEDIREIRRHLKCTSQELATLLGVSVSTVSRWETGKNHPSKLAQSKLKEILSKEGTI